MNTQNPYRILLNPSLGDVPGMKEDRNYSFDEVYKLLSDILPRFQGDAVFRSTTIEETIEQLFQSGQRQFYFWDEMTKLTEMLFVRNCIPFQRPIVDVCCGYGYWISKNLRYVDLGIDLYPDTGQPFARTIDGVGERGFIDDTYQVVMRADATKPLPIPDSTCGTVLAICALEHIRNCADAVAQISRILRPGGHFCFTVQTDLFIERYESFFGKSHADVIREKHMCQFLASRKAWHEILARNGFAILKEAGHFDPLRTLMYGLFFYKDGFDAVWNHQNFGQMLREDAGLYTVCKGEFLPWLSAPCHPDKAGLLCFHCVLNK